MHHVKANITSCINYDADDEFIVVYGKLYEDEASSLEVI